MSRWQIHEAKSRFSELVEEARKKGPQIVIKHGAECAVVLSVEDYRALTTRKPGFKEYLLGEPKIDDFEIERDGDTGCEINL